MWRRNKKSAVPATLVADIDRALAHVDTARARLDRVQESSLPERRRAHAELRGAFLAADALLRAATRAAKAHSFREGSWWRHRLSQLDVSRQQHLFEESDDLGVLQLGSVRAVDTGMSGPAIGDFLHGECSPAGTAAEYGLDLDALLTAPRQDRVFPPSPSRTASSVTVARLPEPASAAAPSKAA